VSTPGNPINAADYTNLVLCNFPCDQWGAAYEGLLQGVEAWNAKHADSTHPPVAFLLTVCRRRVMDAIRAGSVIPAYRQYSIALSRASLSRQQSGARTIRYLMFTDDVHGTDAQCPFLTSDDYARGVVEYVTDQDGFLTGRDDTDRDIIRLCVAGNTPRVVCQTLGIGEPEYYRRMDYMRRAWRLRDLLDSRPPAK
jgi:hypothetical protein